MTKQLRHITALLRNTPFAVTTLRSGRYTFYKFYDQSCTERQAEYHQVLGHEVLGHQNATNYAQGLAMGYSRKTIVIRKNGTDSEGGRAADSEGGRAADSEGGRAADSEGGRA